MRPDTDPVTWGDLKRVYKKLDGRIDELFDELHRENDTLRADWDTHQDLLDRLRRAFNRLKKEVEE